MSSDRFKERPGFIDVRTNSSMSVPRALRSPRLHVAGEATPELSPLDAFALQSRLLAKQLETGTRQGRRMSRLPPLTIASPLIVQARSEYFRSMAQDPADEATDSLPPLPKPNMPKNMDIANDIGERPQSVHPRLSQITPTPADDPVPDLPLRMRDMARAIRLDSMEEEEGNYFGVGARREQSPIPLERTLSAESRTDTDSRGGTTFDSLPPAHASPMSSHSMAANSPERLPKKSSFDAGTLYPPRSLFPKRTSSIVSSPMDSVDGEVTSSWGSSFNPQEMRKLSIGSSNLASPSLPYGRSASISSDMSNLPRPSFNFSRPMSRSGTPTMETPLRQASTDSYAESQLSFLLADEAANTPVSMHDDPSRSESSLDDGTGAAPSYIYSKFSLPRGKTLQRSSAMLLEDQPRAQYQWQQPTPTGPSNVQKLPLSGQPPPSPPTRPSSAGSIGGLPSRIAATKEAAHVLRPGFQQPSPDPSRPSTDQESRASEDVPRGRSLTSPAHDAAAFEASAAPRDRSVADKSVRTNGSASTIKPGPSSIAPSTAPTMSDISPEEHVTKAIALHERGALNESAWHLRHAAKANHPTGMLLYALACRHGWGMRPNQREGVRWLRLAAESAQLELADSEGQARDGKAVDITESKTRKAQFALSIYELGVSHMNGWGIEQDKALALRCFEIAGSWGDVDALAEAGFCYAQGIGCKKNLKKSAKFYREAEAKGMSMVGNSWIHKSKYDDDGKESIKEKKARSKSRGRKGIFGRKGT